MTRTGHVLSLWPAVPPKPSPMSGAVFSDDRRYRYRLWRRWAAGAAVAFIGLNPSTADETQDDPTIRRCIGFAKAWGFAAYEMLNLWAWRSTQPRALLDQPPPPDNANDDAIVTVAKMVPRIVLAWGSHVFLGPNLVARADRVRRILLEVKEDRPSLEIGFLGTNTDGQPKHPLYLPKTTTFRPISWREP